MKAILKNYRQSPRKVRLVADSVKGKKVEDALLKLAFMPKRATDVVVNLIKSAVANAKENLDVSDPLFVKNIEINQGVTLKRFRPRARGSAFRINKRTSNIVVTLAPVSEMKIKGKKSSTPVKKVEEKEQKAVKKVAKKKIAKKKAVKKSSPKADK